MISKNTTTHCRPTLIHALVANFGRRKFVFLTLFAQTNSRENFRIDSILANSACPDDIPHYITFHLGSTVLPRYMFRDSQCKNG